jgi:hypothetical protein
MGHVKKGQPKPALELDQLGSGLAPKLEIERTEWLIE